MWLNRTQASGTGARRVEIVKIKHVYMLMCLDVIKLTVYDRSNRSWSFV